MARIARKSSGINMHSYEDSSALLQSAEHYFELSRFVTNVTNQANLIHIWPHTHQTDIPSSAAETSILLQIARQHQDESTAKEELCNCMLSCNIAHTAALS